MKGSPAETAGKKASRISKNRSKEQVRDIKSPEKKIGPDVIGKNF